MKTLYEIFSKNNLPDHDNRLLPYEFTYEEKRVTDEDIRRMKLQEDEERQYFETIKNNL